MQKIYLQCINFSLFYCKTISKWLLHCYLRMRRYLLSEIKDITAERLSLDIYFMRIVKEKNIFFVIYLFYVSFYLEPPQEDWETVDCLRHFPSLTSHRSFRSSPASIRFWLSLFRFPIFAYRQPLHWDVSILPLSLSSL